MEVTDLEIERLLEIIKWQEAQLKCLKNDPLWYSMRKHKGLRRVITLLYSIKNRYTDKKFRLLFKNMKKAIKNSEIISKSGLFDADWYLRHHFEANYSGLTPAEHYLFFGLDGRAPSEEFDARDYYARYPDVLIKSMNPLLHFTMVGQKEGRTYNKVNEYFNSEAQNIFIASNNGDDASNRYKSWLKNTEPLLFQNTFRILDIGAESSKNKIPKFSVIMPVYNTDPILLSKAINSVLNQTYVNWELCISDDCSERKETIQTLKKYQNNDKIKISFRTSNGHISNCSNDACRLASGEFLVFLDHDDELSPHALNEVAICLYQNPQAKMVYSDEDKLDPKGRRVNPFFKPDFSIDYLCSINYICHLLVLKKEVFDKIGGFRIGLEGAQDYDLILRSVAEIKDYKNTICHIPKILYHWRITPQSTASNLDTKPYAAIASLKAINDYLTNNEKPAKAEMIRPTINKVTWEIPSATPPLVSLVIGTKDKVNLLKTCVESILNRTIYPNYEIVIIDNGTSQPDALAYLNQITNNPKIKVYHYPITPFNFSAINNFGVSVSNGDVIGLLNNDIEIMSEDWLNVMMANVLRPEIGCVGPKLLYPDSTIQHAGITLGIGGVAGHPYRHFAADDIGYFGQLFLPRNVAAVTGAVLFVRKSLFLSVGGLDEMNLPVAFSDVDLCLKVWEKGYFNLFTPHVTIMHHESASRGPETTPSKKERFDYEYGFMLQKWNDILKRDPFYNPNLSLANEKNEICG